MKEAPILIALPKRSSLTALIKSPRFWLAVALLSCVLLCFFGPLNGLLDRTFLVAHLEKWGSWAVCLFVLAFALATVLGLPGAVFPIAGGAVFGLFWGTLWSVMGATLGAMGVFWVAPSGASRLCKSAEMNAIMISAGGRRRIFFAR